MTQFKYYKTSKKNSRCFISHDGDMQQNKQSNRKNNKTNKNKTNM